MSFAPALHAHYLESKYLVKFNPWGWAIGGGIYILGSVVYALKVPERYYPKKFDFIVRYLTHRSFFNLIRWKALSYTIKLNILFRDLLTRSSTLWLWLLLWFTTTLWSRCFITDKSRLALWISLTIFEFEKGRETSRTSSYSKDLIINDTKIWNFRVSLFKILLGNIFKDDWIRMRWDLLFPRWIR